MNISTNSFDPLEPLEYQALFKKLVGWYQDDITHVEQWRKNAQEDYDFYNGRQWNEQDLAVLREQNRPVMTFNRIAPLINAVIGAERNNKRQVQFIPRQEGAAFANEILTGAAEWFRDEADGEYEDSDAFQDAIICGMGWTDTRLDYEEDPQGKPVIARLDPMKMVWDASAVKPNLIDAQHVWYIDEKPLAVAKEMFPHVHWSDLHADWVKNYSVLHHMSNSDTQSYGEDEGRSFQSPKMVTLAECRWFEREVVYRVLDPLTGKFTDYSELEFQSLWKEYPNIQATRSTRKIVKRAFLGKNCLMFLISLWCRLINWGGSVLLALLISSVDSFMALLNQQKIRNDGRINILVKSCICSIVSQKAESWRNGMLLMMTGKLWKVGQELIVLLG